MWRVNSNLSEITRTSDLPKNVSDVTTSCMKPHYLFLFPFLNRVFGAKIDVTPKTSIQSAIEDAQPGDTVFLADGEYDQDFKSTRDGLPQKRITIAGSRQAIVKGESKSRIVEINHSYITLDGFTITGMKNDGTKTEDYVDKCLYIIGTNPVEVVREGGLEYESSLDSMVVSNMHITECGGECLRLRSFITNAEVVGNKIDGCGRHDFMFPSSTLNGEAIYIGTSSNQWDDGKNAQLGPDLSRFIWVHENEIHSQGNECIDVKEGTTDVLVEYNICSDQRDPNSAGLDSRSDDIIFRYNEVVNCAGAGVRIGGHTIGDRTYGYNNEVYGNLFSDTDFSSVKVETGKDHNMCENECKGGCSSKGTESDDFRDIEGTCKSTRHINWTTKDKFTSHDEKGVNILLEPEINGKSVKSSTNESGRCDAVKIKKSSTSADDSANLSQTAVDGKAVTRWSVNGKGAWLALDFEEQSRVASFKMSFYKGDTRVQYFDVYGDGAPLMMKSQSSGKSTGLQSFPLETPQSLSRITIFANGNSHDDWNSLAEIMVCMRGQSGEEEKAAEVHDHLAGDEEECETFELDIKEVGASGDDGNEATNVLNKNFKTHWSCSKSICDIVMKLEQTSYVAEIDFAVYEGAERVQQYDIEVETENGWQDVVVDGESRIMRGIQSVDIDVGGVTAIKFIGYGNDKNVWNSLVYLGVVGC